MKELLVIPSDKVPLGEIWFLNSEKLVLTKIINGEKTMKRVMIESPYAGKSQKEYQQKQKYLKACILDSLRKGEAPFASHGFYTQWLDDNISAERTQGMKAGQAWLPVADIVAFYVDHGMSPGMLEVLGLAFERRYYASGQPTLEIRWLYKDGDPC